MGLTEEPGVFRLGLDYEGNSEALQYPFRWSTGPGRELTVIEETAIGPQNYLMPGPDGDSGRPHERLSTAR